MKLADFACAEFYADPYPMYAQLRAAGELLPLGPGLWLTAQHKLVDALLCDRRMGRAYLKGVALRYGEASCTQAVFQSFSRMMLMQNPPEHSRLRSALMQAFNMQRIGELSELVQQIANELIDELPRNGEGDLMTLLALPLPVRVICRLLDVPYADAALFTGASNAMVCALEMAPLNADQLSQANAATLKLQAYFTTVLAQRRAALGDDLVSRLLKLQHDSGSESFSDAELIDNLILLFLAGHETTANMFGNLLIALQRHPAQWQQLLADPTLVRRAVAEGVRYDGSVQLSQRVVLEDATVLGHEFKAGQIIYLLLGSANRDPAVFNNPDDFNIQRPSDESRLITFGGGLHYCLGARLAMLELETMLATVVRRLPQLQLTGLHQLRWHARNTLRGVKQLDARW